MDLFRCPRLAAPSWCCRAPRFAGAVGLGLVLFLSACADPSVESPRASSVALSLTPAAAPRIRLACVDPSGSTGKSFTRGVMSALAKAVSAAAVAGGDPPPVGTAAVAGVDLTVRQILTESRALVAELVRRLPPDLGCARGRLATLAAIAELRHEPLSIRLVRGA